MASKEGVVEPADARDQVQLQDILSGAFDGAIEIDVRDPSRVQYRSDGVILVVRGNGGAILAAMQGMVVDTCARAEEVLRASVPDDPNLFPALILTKAATVAAHRGQGLNSLLRYHFLRRARGCGVGAVLGCVYPGAPRVRLMERLGYAFTEQKAGVHRAVQPKCGPLLLAMLRSTRLPRAVDHLAQCTVTLQRMYPYRTAAEAGARE